MPNPSVSDMRTSLEDARFFYGKLDPIVRGPEQQQDLELIRRYFRAYLHCWKCILQFVRKVKGLAAKNAWIAWCQKWAHGLEPGDREIFDCLRETRDYDTHQGMIEVKGEIAAGLFPIVMFQPPNRPRRELVSCCDRGLLLADRLIQEHPSV